MSVAGLAALLVEIALTFSEDLFSIHAFPLAETLVPWRGVLTLVGMMLTFAALCWAKPVRQRPFLLVSLSVLLAGFVLPVVMTRIGEGGTVAGMISFAVLALAGLVTTVFSVIAGILMLRNHRELGGMSRFVGISFLVYGVWSLAVWLPVSWASMEVLHFGPQVLRVVMACAVMFYAVWFHRRAP